MAGVSIILLNVSEVAAASVPSSAQAEDYPAVVYKGPKRQPDFKGRDRQYAGFRTRIRDGIKKGPNFAGRMALVIFGCGADCTAGVIADVRTGKVYSFPLNGEVYYRKELDFELQSRLLTAQWVVPATVSVRSLFGKEPNSRSLTSRLLAARKNAKVFLAKRDRPRFSQSA